MKHSRKQEKPNGLSGRTKRIFVVAKTNAKEERVERKDDTHFAVFVKASAVEGKANAAIIKILARYLGIPRSCITLRSGAKGKSKVFEML